jgi:hypothetical protein
MLMRASGSRRCVRANLIGTINQLTCSSRSPSVGLWSMLENLNLVTMLLIVVVGGALFGVTWYSVSSRRGREPALRHTEMSPEDRFRDFWK